MNHIELKQILTDGGIRLTEASHIFRVAQTTVIRWLNGVQAKQVMTYEIACKYAELIKRATEQGLLPVKDVKGKARLVAIKAAIRTAAN